MDFVEVIVICSADNCKTVNRDEHVRLRDISRVGCDRGDRATIVTRYGTIVVTAESAALIRRGLGITV